MRFDRVVSAGCVIVLRAEWDLRKDIVFYVSPTGASGQVFFFKILMINLYQFRSVQFYILYYIFGVVSIFCKGSRHPYISFSADGMKSTGAAVLSIGFEITIVRHDDRNVLYVCERNIRSMKTQVGPLGCANSTLLVPFTGFIYYVCPPRGLIQFTDVISFMRRTGGLHPSQQPGVCG